MNLQIVDLDQKAVKQSDLLREAKANEANYLLYLSKREQEKTSDALDAETDCQCGDCRSAESCRYCLHTAHCWFLSSDCCSRHCREPVRPLSPNISTRRSALLTKSTDILQMPVLASMPKKVA